VPRHHPFRTTRHGSRAGDRRPRPAPPSSRAAVCPIWRGRSAVSCSGSPHGVRAISVSSAIDPSIPYSAPLISYSGLTHLVQRTPWSRTSISLSPCNLRARLSRCDFRVRGESARRGRMRATTRAVRARRSGVRMRA
jgi:hypothetical protein